MRSSVYAKSRSVLNADVHRARQCEIPLLLIVLLIEPLPWKVVVRPNKPTNETVRNTWRSWVLPVSWRSSAELLVQVRVILGFFVQLGEEYLGKGVVVDAVVEPPGDVREGDV